MLGWLLKKTPAQVLNNGLSKNRRRLSKIEGGAAAVCTEFLEYFTENSVFKGFGFIIEDDTPHENHFITYASLRLLALAPQFTKEDAKVARTLSETCFVIANRIVSNAEFKKIMFGTTPDLVGMLAARDEKSKAAWKAWDNDQDTLKRVLDL